MSTDQQSEQNARNESERDEHSGAGARSEADRRRHATIRYTLLRLAIFVGCFLVVWGLVALGAVPSGLGDSNLLWVLLLSLVLSAPLSWVLLRKQRDAMSEQIVERVDRAKERLSANQSQED